MFLSVDTFYFRFLSVITFSKAKTNYVYQTLGGRSIGVKTIENPHRDDQQVAVAA